MWHKQRRGQRKPSYCTLLYSSYPQTCTTNTCDQCTGGFFFQSNTCIATNGAFGSWSVSVDCNSDNSPPERALPPPGNFAITWCVVTY